MGIDLHTCRWLLSAWKNGINFRRTLTIGRQFCYLDWAELQPLLRSYDVDPTGLEQAASGWLDPLLRALGAQVVDSLDLSDFENATILHNLNEPVRHDLKSRFDVLIDAGSLEHIFNVPVALRNCMEMLDVGGSYLAALPANNWCGHGFYQFSPDLMHRVFSPENGFITERIVLYEWRKDAEWYEISDVLESGRSVAFANGHQTTCLIHAKKVEQRPLFAKMPEQGFYQLMWKGQMAGKYSMTSFRKAASGHPSVVERIRERTPDELTQLRERLASVEESNAWHLQQATNWERQVAERDQTIHELRGWVRILEEAKQWNEQQAAFWKSEALRAQGISNGAVGESRAASDRPADPGEPNSDPHSPEDPQGR